MPNVGMSPAHAAHSLASTSSAGTHTNNKTAKHHAKEKERGARGGGGGDHDRPPHQERIQKKKVHHDADHIKKPLNAFMIYMKENRQKLMEERGYKERQSAELNKELGRMVCVT